MDGKYIGAFAGAAAWSAMYMTSIPLSAGCGGARDLCRQEAVDLPHAPERLPVPDQAAGQLSIQVSTAAKGGTFFQVVKW